MGVLPIGFFMPLPLPIMIPFMMWQSAAIAAGFGTYFQYAKRKVSAMTNEEFNSMNPHTMVETLYEDIVQSMPSSIKRMESMNIVILESLLKMLEQALNFGLDTFLQGGQSIANRLNPEFTGEDIPDFIPTAGGELGAPDSTTPDVRPSPEVANTRFDRFTNTSYLYPRPMSLPLVQSFSETELKLARSRALDNQYNAAGRTLIFDEIEKRGLSTEVIESPNTTPTNLTPTFVASLTQSDVEIGGSRTRATAQGLITWNGVAKITYISKTLTQLNWRLGKWISTPNIFKDLTISQADSKVNTIKRNFNASYVLVFGTTYYLLKG